MASKNRCRKSTLPSQEFNCKKSRKNEPDLQQSTSERNSVESIVSNDDDNSILNKLNNIKKVLTNRRSVIEFLSENNANVSFLVSLGHKMSGKIFTAWQSNLLKKEILLEVINLLATICDFSLSGCYKVKSSYMVTNSAQLLESKKVCSSIKCALLRLLGSISRHRDASEILLSKSTLLDRIVLEIASTDSEISRNALRIVRIMARQTIYNKKLISSNACFSVGILISKRGARQVWNQSDILLILTLLSKSYTADVGRQLTTSGCVMNLLEIYNIKRNHSNLTIKDEQIIRQWQKVILRCIRRSHELRHAFGKRAIDYFLRFKKFSEDDFMFLSVFLEDSIERSYLCEAGVFDDILSLLSSSGNTDSTDFQLELFNRLCNVKLLYDQECLSKICNHPTFISSAILRVEQYLAKNRTKCSVDTNFCSQVPLDDEIMPSVQSEEQQSNYDNDQTSNSTSTLLEFDPDNSQTSPSISPNLSQANSPMSPSPFQISPSMSPNFPCQISPSMSPNPTVSSGSALSPSSSFIDEFFSADEPIEQIEEEMENEHSIANSKSNSPFSNIEDVIMECENFTPLNRQLSNSSNIMESEDPAHPNEKEITTCCVNIISNIPQQDRYNRLLISKETLMTLINYLSDSETYHHGLERSLLRLAKNNIMLRKLIEIDFHKMVVNKLIRRDCILRRFSSECQRCVKRRDFGRELLIAFISQVDTHIGWYELKKLCDPTNDDDTRVRGLTSSLILIRRNLNRNQLYHFFKPIEFLVELLGPLIQSFAEFNDNDTQCETNPKAHLCWEIISSFSSLLSRKGIERIPGLDARNFQTNLSGQTHLFTPNRSPCVLSNISPNEQMLRFYDGDQIIAQVPKTSLCQHNGYYSSMFQNEFLETVQAKQDFKFDEELESCPPEDFIKFLHLSIGCELGSDCVRIDTTETYASLLILADKYMCSGISAKMLGKNTAERMVDGDSLKSYLSICFIAPHIMHHLQSTCILVLLRYTNFKQMCETFRYISSNLRAIKMLQEMLLSTVSLLIEPHLFFPTEMANYWDF